MSLRPLFFAASALVVGLGACMLNTAGLPSTAADGAGGAMGVTAGTRATGGGGSVEATTAGGGQAAVTSASAGSSAASSAASSSASSSASVSSSSSSGGGVTCASQYSGAASYQLCKSTTNTCEFNVQLNGTNCGVVCAGLGGECLATLDNGNACDYLVTPDQLCDHLYGNAICRCSLGCGAGPPCAANKTCVAGVCK